MSVSRQDRFRNASNPCPICGGHDRNNRDSEKRCGGFLSEDGKYAHCTSSQYAAGLARTSAGTFAHYLGGACRCGVEHISSLLTVVERRPNREIIATYDYDDESGNQVFQVIRYSPKGFSQRRSDGKGSWVYNLEGIRRVLYRLPLLLASDKSQLVFLVEGEKDADRLGQLGLTATCNPMGAGKWLESYNQWFVGRHVIILPDNDPIGEQHAKTVGRNLAGKVASLKIVQLPDLSLKEDVSDWLEKGHTAKELLTLVEAEDYENEPEPKKLWHADELDQFPIPTWLVNPEMMRYTLSLLIGEPGCGKTFVALHYALRIAETENVIYVAGEGAGGIFQRITAWRNYYKPIACNFYLWNEPVEMLNDEKVARFVQAISSLKPALIVIDTLARASVGADENSARDMGLVIAACDRIRLATKAHIQLVHHTTKNGNTERGSSALRGAADTVIRVTAEDSVVRLACVKQKDAPEFDDKWLSWQEALDSRVLVTGPRNLTCEGVTTAQRRLLETLALEVFEKSGAKSNKLVDITNLSASAVYNALSQLKRKGYITQSDRGEPFYITQSGRDIIKPAETLF